MSLLTVKGCHERNEKREGKHDLKIRLAEEQNR